VDSPGPPRVRDCPRAKPTISTRIRGDDSVVDSKPGAWLRQQREARGWSKAEMARRLVQAGYDSGDTAMPSATSMLHNIYRWERGDGGLSERHQLHYCRALGIHPSQFGSSQPSQPPASATGGTTGAIAVPAVSPAPEVIVPVPVSLTSQPPPTLPAFGAVTYGGRQESLLGDSVVQREVLMAAHEGSEHAEHAGQPGVGEATFEQLRADVTRLARLVEAGEPFAAFLDLRRVRDRIHRILEGRLWPREQTDLYFLLGCLNGLMAIPANQLGYPDAATELNRAGWAYAHAIDHRPLMAILRGELSVYAYYRGRFEESRDLALSGLQYLPVGPHAAGLHLYHARAVGRLGDADTARQAVHDAHEARARDYDDDLLEIGGTYLISEATHHALAGAALTATASTDPEAAGELERAVSLYDEGPRGREEHWFGGKPLAGIDLAVVRLRSGALDAAAVALQPVLSLPITQRISDMTIRLAAAREELTAPIFHGSPQARDLGTQIEEFGREAVTSGLHSLSGGPG
jgi:transcriptional regulator with XRE-family HTH domain/tetratricopeptide (TPR) repeat protein